MSDTQTTIQRSRDFDFFFGRWIVHNRRLRHPLRESNEWESFDGIQICAPLLGGLANYDELQTLDGEPVGMSIHLYDLATKRWSSTWVSTRDGAMQPAVTGGFADGRGVFVGADVHDGRPILVRYTWTRMDTPTPRWEQAYSRDGGVEWETNWVMDYETAEASH